VMGIYPMGYAIELDKYLKSPHQEHP
jgi:hypothetical protein